MASTASCFRVTYTVDGHKKLHKNWRWLDGFVTQSGHDAMLYSEYGAFFDIVLLDECSQMVEPLSVVPLLRAKARFLIAAGDPLQLPPVVASPAHVTAGPGQVPPQQRPHGLLRPLFVRLAELGLPPFLLRRQYRCHPDISAVPNAQFYGGRLLDGCTREQRASLLPGLPSLAFLDVRGQEQYGAGRSASNQAEAEAVAAAVEALVAAGVAPGRCGVITFFRAQVVLVRSLLKRRLPQLEQRLQQRREAEGEGSEDEGGGEQQPQTVQVATVDSFQGAECDAIVLTTAVTRTSNFASDACRLNVALTRARHNLLVVGCAPALQQSSPAFAVLLARCRSMPGGYVPGGRLLAAASRPVTAIPAPAPVQPTALLPVAVAPVLQQAMARAAAAAEDGAEVSWSDEEGASTE